MENNNYFYFYEKGKEEFLAGDYEKARQYLEKFLKYKDNFADVYNFLGFIYYISNDLNRAIDFYEKAIELNPYYTEALMNITVIYHSIGEYEKAEKYFKMLKENKNIKGIADKHCIGKLANIHAELAKKYLSLFMYDEALEEYEKALKLAPEFPDIRLAYANALRDANKLEEAIFQYDQVLIRKPKYIEALINQAITFYKLGYLGFALEALKKAKLIDANNKNLQAFLYLLENSKEVE
ncbi:tetratricopeptide repeat protein [Deferribacter desulfuricans SSM1]|uniref:Tetratricopeptide repeat protein n=1 Tax=Deferribacter desulfuricans (strain DSM 14783 / JCM 11476 / NBRC 101012 / SSM1) TaxID=639282 RepID=D3P9L7_DEFDS|nr:tetratricopeptide repeat protein [Deferribacter desulfuricans]BAI81407.1 tetratricopeptide repeat protein [Deferribacter desulfuricans SSM1]